MICEHIKRLAGTSKDMYNKFYKIHNILSIQINTAYKCVLKGLNYPLAFFEVDKIDKPDILLNIGNFVPSNTDCYLIDHTYYIKENYLYCKDSKLEVEINGLEKTPTIINFNGKSPGLHRYIAPDLFAQDIVLLPLIELVLGSKGYLLAHGGGIDKDGATIFIGRGGSMKTTVIINAVKNGLKIFGDDRLIIDTKQKSVYSFLIYPKIFKYISERSDGEYLSITKKIFLPFHLLKDRSDINFISQKESSNIKSIYLIKRKNICENKVHILENNVAIKKIIANNKAEMYSSSIPSIKKRNFVEYLIAYCFVFPDSHIATYWDGLRSNLEDVVKNIPIYEIEISKNYNSKIFDKIFI